MSQFRNTTTGEVRDFDAALLAAWRVAGNPKAAQWAEYVESAELKCYSKDDYDAAMQAAIDAIVVGMPADYQDRAEVALLAAAPNPYQPEAQALVAWIGELWSVRSEFSDYSAPGMTPDSYVAALLQAHPAPTA
jgi:hypothetical protein